MISEKGLCKVLSAAYKGGGYSVIPVQRRMETAAKARRRKRAARKSIFAAALDILASAVLFATLAITEPVVVVAKELDQNLQPMVLMVPEVGEV